MDPWLPKGAGGARNWMEMLHWRRISLTKRGFGHGRPCSSKARTGKNRVFLLDGRCPDPDSGPVFRLPNPDSRLSDEPDSKSERERPHRGRYRPSSRRYIPHVPARTLPTTSRQDHPHARVHRLNPTTPAPPDHDRVPSSPLRAHDAVVPAAEERRPRREAVRRRLRLLRQPGHPRPVLPLLQEAPQRRRRQRLRRLRRRHGIRTRRAIRVRTAAAGGARR